MYSCHGIHWSLIVWCLYDVIAYKFFPGLSHVWFINLSPNVYILAVIRFIFPIIFIYLMYFRVFWFVKYFFYFTFVEREFFVSYALPNDAQYKLCWMVANGLFIDSLHSPPHPPPPPPPHTFYAHKSTLCGGVWRLLMNPISEKSCMIFRSYEIWGLFNFYFILKNQNYCLSSLLH